MTQDLANHNEDLGFYFNHGTGELRTKISHDQLVTFYKQIRIKTLKNSKENEFLSYSTGKKAMHFSALLTVTVAALL